jgi:hypothetical protein
MRIHKHSLTQKDAVYSKELSVFLSLHQQSPLLSFWRFDPSWLGENLQLALVAPSSFPLMCVSFCTNITLGNTWACLALVAKPGRAWLVPGIILTVIFLPQTVALGLAEDLSFSVVGSQWGDGSDLDLFHFSLMDVCYASLCHCLADSALEGKGSGFLDSTVAQCSCPGILSQRKTRAEKGVGYRGPLTPTGQGDIWADASLCCGERLTSTHRPWVKSGHFRSGVTLNFKLEQLDSSSCSVPGS